MSSTQKEIGTATTSPTKQFFVTMLTRDIELQDALLDLLDNCVDGIVRSGKKADGAKPYEGFWAKIILEKGRFEIEDNCGGIPYDIAEKYAFTMGRPPGVDGGETIGTVGMYGIGMKRAIFKMGTNARVESRNDKGFLVQIDQRWMQENKWTDLPMFELPEIDLANGGTRIVIDKLNDETGASFSDPAWVDEFRKTVAKHYALIIAKGFLVTIGTSVEIKKSEVEVRAEPFKLLAAAPDPNGNALAPHLFTGKLHDVDVEIYIGLYRRLLTEEEQNEEDETRGRSDDAGWTVACNDRIVIWKDKTKLTGWGEASVPNYHGQFIAITGILLLKADDPKKLPLTTTKRGIDGGSQLYLDAKDMMRNATKTFTNFTNKWKKFPDKLESIYKDSHYVDLPGLRAMAAEVKGDVVRKYPSMTKAEVTLPTPPNEKSGTRVSFVAEKSDVELVAKFLFDDITVKPSTVGEAAFKATLKDAKK